MSDSTDRQGTGGEEPAPAECHREDAPSGGNADSNRSNWRRKLVLTALGAVLGGIIRGILDWALSEICP